MADSPVSSAFFKKQNQSKFFLFGVLLALIPAAFTAWVIARYPAYALYLDDWSYVYLSILLDKGILGFSDLWATSNDHLILFPRLIILSIARLTGWDPRALFAFNFLLAAGAWLFMVLMVRRERAALGEKNFLWIPFALAVFVFSLRQVENWVWCAEVVFYLPSLCGAFSFFLLSRAGFSWKFFSAALVSTLVASCSFLSGFLLWPSGMLMIFFSLADDRSRRTKALLIWSLAAAAITALYAFTYEKPSYHPALVYEVPALLHYLVLYLGSPLAYLPEAAFSLGLSALVLFSALAGGLFYFRPFQAHVVAAFSAPGVFAILNGVVTAVGRAGFGVDQALASRYTVFSAGLWISILLLCVLVSRAFVLRLPSNSKWKFFLAALPLLLCFAVTAQAARTSFRSLPGIVLHQERLNRVGIEILDSTDADLSLLYADPSLIQGPLNFLKRKKMNIFDPKLAALLRQAVTRE